jgi:hypothetical protein
MASACLAVLVLTTLGRAAEYEEKAGKGEIRLSAEMDKEGRAVVRLAGVKLTVRVTGKAPLAVKWDPVTRTEGWTVTKAGGARQDKDRTTWEQEYNLEPPAKTGDIPPLQLEPLSYREGKGAEQTVKWKPIRVRVPKPSSAQLRPNTGPEELPESESWYQPLVWVGLALVLAALGLVVWEVVRRRLRRASALTPDGWALRELDKIAALDLSVSAEVERFPTLLSDVIRRYLELRFRLPATRQTSAEFLETAQKSPQLSAAHQAMLRNFLHLCDMAKFARETLSVENCRTLTGEARHFVEQTAAPAGPEG